ncbi:MAG: hypothetical protein GC154_06450 [bacterium]|nr:hypothetical protein [bacterium]
MPKLSDTMVTAKLLNWLKQEGDAVEEGDAIAEIETDKAAMELEALESGTLLKIVASVGEELPAGAVIAVIGKPGEDAEAMLAQRPGA